MDGAAELAASLLWYEAVSAASATQKMAWGGGPRATNGYSKCKSPLLSIRLKLKLLNGSMKGKVEV